MNSRLPDNRADDHSRPLDDRIDALVARYSDDLDNGTAHSRDHYLSQLPPEVRPGLERCLKMIEAGTAHTPSTAQPLLSGLQLDHYRLIRELGRGGMALVWLAHDNELGRPVAIKILRPGLALEQRHRDRFRREALAVARLKHPHIVQIYGAGEAHGYHYLAMEFVAGPSLATALDALPRDRNWTAEDLARVTGIPSLGLSHTTYEQALAALLAPLAAALQTAHELGLVHRDIKPSNILLQEDGRAVIADFGLAKGDDDPALSLSGDALGTAYYMSPEQAYVSGKRVDHRTDIYSLGVTLYEALTGVRPFRGDSFLEVIEAIRSTSPPPIRALNTACTRNANEVVRKCMARDPEQRYESADGLHEDLIALGEDRTTEALRHAGGPARRLVAQWRLMSSGYPYEYVSARKFLGLPLVHIISGRRQPGQRMRVAKGWFAVGEIAIGGVAIGTLAFGGITTGAVGAGLFSCAALGVGLFVFAGMGLGVVSFSGIALGWLAIGGVALGYGAMGGMARGHYAAGGDARGDYILTNTHQDPQARAFFDGVWPDLLHWFGNSGGS